MAEKGVEVGLISKCWQDPIIAGSRTYIVALEGVARVALDSLCNAVDALGVSQLRPLLTVKRAEPGLLIPDGLIYQLA